MSAHSLRDSRGSLCACLLPSTLHSHRPILLVFCCQVLSRPVRSCSYKIAEKNYWFVFLEPGSGGGLRPSSPHLRDLSAPGSSPPPCISEVPSSICAYPGVVGEPGWVIPAAQGCIFPSPGSPVRSQAAETGLPSLLGLSCLLSISPSSFRPISFRFCLFFVSFACAPAHPSRACPVPPECLSSCLPSSPFSPSLTSSGSSCVFCCCLRKRTQ